MAVRLTGSYSRPGRPEKSGRGFKIQTNIGAWRQAGLHAYIVPSLAPEKKVYHT